MNYGKLTAGTTKTAIDTAKPSEKGEIITYLSRMGDVLEQIFERSVLIAFAVKRIVIVIDSDIADIPPRKKYLGIIADLNIIAPETGKVFGNQSGDPSFLHQFQKPLKIRTVEADTGIAVIHKNFDVFKAVILYVFGQNGFLIDDAVAVTFVFIFLRETAVQRRDFLFVLV